MKCDRLDYVTNTENIIIKGGNLKLEIKGEIKEIIFQNEINSYTIAVLQTETEELTVVGYLPFITIGDSLKLEGKYVEHQEYGRQFKIDTFEKIMPETLDSLERYLGNGTIKGVGPATAKRIVDYFQGCMELPYFTKYSSPPF